MKNEKSDQDDLIKKLATKAKRKLNRIVEDEVVNVQKLGVYEFVESERNEARKKLEKKISQVLKNNPDCDNPIGRLIDHSLFDNLSSEQKQAYILKLSRDYAEISEKLRYK